MNFFDQNVIYAYIAIFLFFIIVNNFGIAFWDFSEIVRKFSKKNK